MKEITMKLIVICVGASLGAVSRYLLTAGADNLFKGHFPWGTFVVNSLGCLLIGAAFGLLISKPVHLGFQPFFITGFLGSFTTFSTYMMDIVSLSKDGKHAHALTSFITHNLVGIVMVLVGAFAIELITKSSAIHN
ncbi:MAG: CrcB family protein [Candidatus Zophobacter franzmannii]|nr:CrcB family protein [Candidatus Zophobacter franzmannii]